MQCVGLVFLLPPCFILPFVLEDAQCQVCRFVFPSGGVIVLLFSPRRWLRLSPPTDRRWTIFLFPLRCPAFLNPRPRTSWFFSVSVGDAVACPLLRLKIGRRIPHRFVATSQFLTRYTFFPDRQFLFFPIEASVTPHRTFSTPGDFFSPFLLLPNH